MNLPELVPGVLAAVGAASGLYIALAWLLARLWCRPRRMAASRTPSDFDLPFEAVQIATQRASLSGWFIPAAVGVAPRPVVLLMHGWSRNAAEMLPLARLLHEASFAVLLYDARGHGASGADGPITILKLAEDIIAGIRYLEARPDVDKNQIGVMGRSIGGSAAILAASMEPLIRAVASCSAFADPKALTLDFLRMMHVPSRLFARPVVRFIEQWLGTTMDSVTPRTCIRRIDAPLLLIHGEADSFIPPSNMHTLCAEAREHAEQLLIPGRGHSDVLRDARCSQGIVAFLGRALLAADDQAAPLIGLSLQEMGAEAL